MKLYRVELSTNVERVALALAHKRLEVESIVVPYGDRSEIRRVSGQDLVPVLADGETIMTDSMQIVRFLEERFPDRPALFPDAPARRAECDLFIDWFDRAWKRPPGLIHQELRKPEGERNMSRVERLGKAIECTRRKQQPSMKTLTVAGVGRSRRIARNPRLSTCSWYAVKFAVFSE